MVAERKMPVPAVMAVTKEFAGMLVPVMGMPGIRPAVLLTVMELEALVVVPETETLPQS